MSELGIDVSTGVWPQQYAHRSARRNARRGNSAFVRGRPRWLGASLLWLCLAWLCALAGGPAFAAEQDRLYNVGVDVASRSLEDRRAGAAEGLRTMLTRLSGLTALPESAALRSALARPDRFYTQYRYYSTDRYDELGSPLTQLNLQFSPQALRSLMTAAQLPLWTLNRPTVAIWIAERNGEGLDIIEDPTHPLLQAVIERADYRGLPSVVPGVVGLSATRVWNRDRAALQKASEQVGADIILIGRAEQSDVDAWQVRWSTWGRGDADGARNLQLSGSLESSTADAVDMVVRGLVSEFTVAGGEAGTLELVVENVAAVDDYAQLLKYLSALSYVESVSVNNLIGDELSVMVNTTSSPEKFLQLLAIDSRLVESTRPRMPPPLPARSGTLGDEAAQPIPVAVLAEARLRVAWQG